MAKSKYGVSPWGAWFIEALEGYEMGPRLARGRTYANTGRVISLEITAGKAVAKVAGNYQPFYQVAVEFDPLKEAAAVYRMIEEDPALLSRIAQGELPETFLEKLKKAGIALIPRRWKEMRRSCTCPDYGDPCKHMAALYYILAREIDADPSVLFRLRGMDLAARFGKMTSREIPAPFVITAVPKNQNNPNAAPEDRKTLVETALAEIPAAAELIRSILPPDPPFSSKNFALTLAEFYHEAAAAMLLDDGDAAGAASSIEHRFSRSEWTVRCDNPGPGARPILEEKDVRGRIHTHEVFDAWRQFSRFSDHGETGTGGFTFLLCLFKFISLALRAGAFIPFVLHKDGALRIVWKPYDAIPPVARALDSLAQLEPGLFPLDDGNDAGGRSVVDLIASAVLNDWVRRQWFIHRQHGGGKDYQQLLGLFFQGAPVPVDTPAQRPLPLSIDRWLSVLHIDFSGGQYQLTVKQLKTRGASDETADEAVEADTAFVLSIDALRQNEDGLVIKTPLSVLAKGKDTGYTREKAVSVLRPLTALSNYLPEISVLMKQKSALLSGERLASFLESAAPLLTRLGIAVNLPKSLSKELKPRLVLKTTGKDGGGMGGYLDLEELLTWKWQIAIGDTVLDIKEFKKLLKEKRALVRFRNGYIKIDAGELALLLKKAQSPPPKTALEFIKTHFSGDSVLSFDAQKVIERLFEERRFDPPAALTAVLRPYQQRGYNWACSLLMAGFGCVLADDMGLGKTVEAVAVLLRLREEGLLTDGCLVVAPAALLSNWEKELLRFAPTLKTARYHGTGRRLNREKHDVFLTTYQTAARDSAKLTDEVFSLLIVDEAQLMKNAETRIARAVKTLRPRFRLALSGTPVENRLEDLRSLFDFILPGYLGTGADFKTAFRYPIETLRSREKAEQLRKITAPFLLRRLKTDKTIINDLPEKITSNEYAELEKEQAALYENIVREMMKKVGNAERKERSMLIFSLLTSLKQVCNHPRVYDKESPARSALSGKARLLLTLLDEIIASGEKTLVFSQYVETLDCLNQIITSEIGEAPLLYHGGMNQKTRQAVIERFQTEDSARILLISLKAGGLGLNLTAGNHVVHYDLWFNPAVENQATDRAFRIGQRRTVFVHRLITKNTFEETIDAMITGKKELAEMTVASGESWLTRMSREELTTLFGR